MGEARRKSAKRDRFYRDHPFCCFCGGKENASTIDHVPNRASFKGRLVPEGYEFPACVKCQHKSRKAEMAFSFAIRMLEFDQNNLEPELMYKMISGLVNNFPAAVPNPYLSANEKRRALRRFGLRSSEGTFLKDAPVTSMPLAMDASIRAYSVKIAQALWYREKRTIVPRGYFFNTTWRQAVDRNAVALFEETAKITPLITVGARSNVSIGNSFVYRCNYAFDPDIMLVACQFGQSIATVCLISEPQAKERMDFVEQWGAVDEVFANPCLL